MKLFKSVVIYSMIIISFFLLFFSSKIVNLIPSKEIRTVILIIGYIIIFIFIISDTCRDITKKNLSTSLYIVLADIIQIIAYAAMGYLSIMIYKTVNIEILLRLNGERILAVLLLLGATLIRRLLHVLCIDNNK